MKRNLFVALAFLSPAALISCNEKTDPATAEGKPMRTSVTAAAAGGTFIDQGFIPATLSSSRSESEFQSAVYNNGFVYVATSDGVWKNELATKQWSRAGLGGRKISCLFKHPTIANKFYAGTLTNGAPSDKTLYISGNGGSNWQAATAPVFDSVSRRYENYACLAVRPGNPNHIYANLEGGTMIAVSVDGGLTWKRMNNEPGSFEGYKSVIGFLPGNADQVFQGAESPLDDAWFARYDIGKDPVMLSGFRKIVDRNTWENRRPNELQVYSFVPGSFYLGQEGGLSKITGSSAKFIFRSDGVNFPYSYIYGIWVDPLNPAHILFGGAVNNLVQPMSLYETYDEGGTITRFTDKLGMDNPEIREIVSTNSYPAILINDVGVNKVKLVLYRP